MKIGRNDPCPCGSGLKYKRCHLDEDAARARAAAEAGFVDEPERPRGPAQAMVDFVQPLLDQTDGSSEQVERVMRLGMMWWNLAILPPSERARMLNETVEEMELDAEARDSFLEATHAMIARHESMFPALHAR